MLIIQYNYNPDPIWNTSPDWLKLPIHMKIIEFDVES